MSPTRVFKRENRALLAVATLTAAAIAVAVSLIVLRVVEAGQTHRALCAFKTDLAERASSTQRFIDDIRTGRRSAIPGITISDLELTLANRQATLDSLKELDCE